MTEDEFKGMVARLERESALAPMAYRAKVAALTVLGFAIFLLLLGTAGLGLLLLVFLAYVLAFGGTGGWLVLLKLGKLLWWLALPMWLLLKSSWKALWVRWPEPAGLPVLPAEAPALFEALADLRKHMRGPRFHRVLLTDEVNAAVVQRPRLGLFGWPKNYLLLGLPLLDSMPAEEALAVVAHEYGHLAGAHARFGAFIYRLRHSWGPVQDLAEHVQGWLARLVVPLVRQGNCKPWIWYKRSYLHLFVQFRSSG
jgi:Zn-dependent protease with chaperone function